MSKEFANPFTISNKDKNRLNSFLDDNGGYEQVTAPADLEGARTNNYGPDYDSSDDDSDEEEEEYEYGNGRPSSRRRRHRLGGDHRTLGNIMNLNNTDSSSSINTVYLTVLCSLVLGLMIFYGLSKGHVEEVRLEGSSPNSNSHIPNNSETNNNNFIQYQDDKDEVGKPLIYDSISNPNQAQPKKSAAILFQEAQEPKMFNPLRIKENNQWDGAPFVVTPPQLPLDVKSSTDILENSRLGYIQHPTIVNKTIVFSTEGDLYLTRLNEDDNHEQPMPAMKLTTTVGNALHPKLNPRYPYLLVYSATYTGVREVYLMDLRSSTSSHGSQGTPGGPALRLTYTPGGISSVVGWNEDGTTILYSSMSRSSNSLPATRLFRLTLSWGGESETKKDGKGHDKNTKVGSDNSEEQQTTEDEEIDTTSKEKDSKTAEADDIDVSPSMNSPVKVAEKTKDDDAHKRRLEKQRRHLAELSQARRNSQSHGKDSLHHSIIEPVPLAQAIEGAYHSDCIYFTRFKQSSSTKRYVGGTAESLWGYCQDKYDNLAFPLTGNYNGTSKSPSIYYTDDEKEDDYIFFMSDRARSTDSKEWLASSMDLWAAPLPLSSSEPILPTRITNVACENNGIDLSEYAIDSSTGGVVLRIGADLHYMSPERVSAKMKNSQQSSSILQPLSIAVYSDFSSMQERIIPMEEGKHITTLDAFATPYGSVSTLVTARGQSFVAPVIADTKSIPQSKYGGGGRNMPARRYKVAPGTGGGGLVRILSAKHVPQPKVTSADVDNGERLALILATDPLSPTGEHAFYLIRVDASSSPAFGFASLYEYGDIDTGMPNPFLGGHLETGGSTRDGGLGSVYANTISISPCGRRFSYTDTDGRIVVVTIPTSPIKIEDGRNLKEVDVVILPRENENGQPLIGDEQTSLVWSPGGRYLAIEHSARNQFKVISIADLGSPDDPIQVGRIVQATTDRFNSFSPVWGKTSKDFVADIYDAALEPTKDTKESGSKALYFLSDRDVKLTGKTSPWGTRAPAPNFDDIVCVHVLPLQTIEDSLVESSVNQYINAPYAGGGALEVSMEGLIEMDFLLDAIQKQTVDLTTDVDESESTNSTDIQTNETQQVTLDDTNTTTGTENDTHPFIIDTPISFGKEKDETFAFARSSYRIDNIPPGHYVEIVCQLADDPSLLMLGELPNGGLGLSLLAIVDWPSDASEQQLAPDDHVLQHVETSSDGQFIITMQNNKIKVISRQVKDMLAFFADTELEKYIADAGGLHLSIWPRLEYRQMYADSWRMLRDYFYDIDMHKVDWDEVFDRYLPLVERCGKREELDDVLKQMIGELSALHSFVYGGEYSSPHHGDEELKAINDIGCLGAEVFRSNEKRGYVIKSISMRDPDLHSMDGERKYSPLSDQVLRMSGQAGLQPGDVIVAINGESVLDVPDIHMLLRNTAGESIRLDVLRINSTSKLKQLRRLLKDASIDEDQVGIVPEPLIVVPITSDECEDLAYTSWEWSSRSLVKSLAKEAGFTCGYAHLRSMSGASAMDSFVRGFYPDFDKDALIIDVRNNRGGNIDSWLLDTLQKKAWMYWESRSTNITNGGLGWDEQFAFRGHLVVLTNEHTSSDGEGFARGVSELGLGKLVGTRTWGGGIWLSSDNKLVDGGISSAPEVGTYNDNLGWGLGIEQMGVTPDIEVDNNPADAYNGEDTQLKRAISVLKEWLEEEPVVLPKRPGKHNDRSKKDIDGGCSA